MQTYNSTPNLLHKEQGKYNHFETQMKQVFAAFKNKPATMLMLSVETGILRANICRYVAKWQKQGCIQPLKKTVCEISKHRAGYYTTDTHLFTPHPKLF